jgi:putative FmdB family regulatory protein
MPIYEYICKSCDAKFELLQRSMNSDAKAKCPSCGSTKAVRAMSVFAAGSSTKSNAGGGDAAPMCGRCGGPGPCPSGY